LNGVGRPDPTEFAAYAQAYVDLVEGADIVSILASQIERTTELIAEFDRRSLSSHAYAPGKWTVKDVIGHMLDTERIFAYRALCVARGESGSLAGFDQDTYARLSGANTRSLEDLSREFRIVRMSTTAFVAGLPRDAWHRRGDVNGYNVTVRGLAFHIAGHELHHVKILREKYLQAR
jgi:uncharacterized damage-inducible protein DinB